MRLQEPVGPAPPRRHSTQKCLFALSDNETLHTEDPEGEICGLGKRIGPFEGVTGHVKNNLTKKKKTTDVQPVPAGHEQTASFKEHIEKCVEPFSSLV